MEVALLDGLQPCGLDWVHTDCVLPFDGLFGGGKVVDAVGLMEGCLGVLAGVAWLPLSVGLYQRNAVAPVCVPHTNEKWHAMLSFEF